MAKGHKTSTMFSECCGATYDHITFVDPGIGGTGLAFFKRVKGQKIIKRDEVFAPKTTKVCKGRDKDDWLSQCWHISSQCAGFFTATQTRLVVIEHPEIWGTSAQSLAAGMGGKTKGEPGGLFKLMCLVGEICAIAHQTTNNLPVLINPAGWKGQLPKKIIDERTVDAIGKKFPNHVGDAVGMGLSVQGKI